jgi:transposase
MNKFTITQFRAAYPDNDACLNKLFELRYRNLICPVCESDKAFTKVKNRRPYQYPSCSFQIYPTQGTVFEKSTTPLTHWFYAIFLQTTTRNGVAAKELERQLNVCYKTALRMAHQIKILMADAKQEALEGVLEADETFIGGLNKNRSC